MFEDFMIENQLFAVDLKIFNCVKETLQREYETK
jgi:hypothetical protein